jgi:hypothetical protein
VFETGRQPTFDGPKLWSRAWANPRQEKSLRNLVTPLQVNVALSTMCTVHTVEVHDQLRVEQTCIDSYTVRLLMATCRRPVTHH